MPKPTPDKTAGWRSYTNSQYGFKLKYPPNYKEASGKFITLLNANKKPEVDAIIATFKLIP